MGFSTHANRKLLKKRRSFSDIRKSYAEETQLSFKQLTDFEQKKLKHKIRAQARLDNRHKIFLFILSFAGVVIPFYVISLLFG